MTAIYSQGEATFTVLDTEKVAIFSNSSVKFYKQVGYPNFPTSWDLIETTDDGETYTSAAMTADTVCKIEAGAAVAYYETGAAPVIGEPLADQSFADATGIIQGLAAAQGGSSTLKGGTSSTAGNAGGAVLLTGGQPGATGVGGAATVAAGAGGATSGAGGVASITGGAGTASNSAGGVSKTVGGAGSGSSAGGAAQLTGGLAGATGIGGAAVIAGGAGGATSGKGGAATIAGGAGTTNADGGSILLTPGALAGTGMAGGIFARSNKRFMSMPTPATATDTASLTDAQMISGVLVATPTAAAAYTVRTGTQLLAALPTDIAADDAFDLVIINIGGTGDDITLTAATDITIVGDAVVRPSADSATEQAGQGTFRFRYTGTTVFVAYRIS